jgi:hypothetical protein
VSRRSAKARYTNRDAEVGVPVSCWQIGASDQRRFAFPICDEQVVTGFRRECVVLVLKPDQFGFQVAYSLLKAAHL